MENSTADVSEALIEEAYDAIEAGDHAQAMLSLKRVVADDPENAMAVYLLATVHAATGMHDRAIEELTKVVKLEPEFHVARFQLGQIFLAHGKIDDALESWQAYTDLPEDHCFFLFYQAMEDFRASRFEASIRTLEACIAANEEFESVVEDMVSILEEIRERAATDAPPAG